MPTPVYVLEVPVADDKSILVEVTDPHRNDLVPAAKPGAFASRAGASLESALAQLQPTLRALTDWAKESAADEFTTEFGIKLSGQTNVIIASGTTEVNFVCRLTWKS